MALNRIKDFDPNYRDHFEGEDVKNLDVYSGSERIGSVDDVLVDDEGRFRYLVINTGAWIFGKKVLLPIGRAQIDYKSHRVNATGLSRQQAESLPEFSEDLLSGYDYDYEERVRNVYRPTTGAAPLEAGAALNTSAALDATPAASSPAPAAFERDSYAYDKEPTLFDINDRDHQNL
ncbi:MAG TPA: PRC-barrel domain-containing protein, partial [Thermosynechococcaceae cyanobacterium]